MRKSCRDSKGKFIPIPSCIGHRNITTKRKITVMSIDNPKQYPILKKCHDNGGVYVRNKCVKTGAKLNYKESDFIIKKGLKNTMDERIPFIFRSKDGEIEANVFNKPGDVHIRALIGDNSNRGHAQIGYPFAEITEKDDKRLLTSFVRALNRGVLRTD